MKKNKILFVCHGNICRSVMAEYIAKHLTRDLTIESRATSLEEIGNDIYPPIKKVLDSHNISYDRHYAKQITQEEFNYFDYIIVMDDYNLINLKRIIKQYDNNKVFKLTNFINKNNDILDPWYTRKFEECYQQIYACVDNLIKKIMR